jgi:hypothetical protein
MIHLSFYFSIKNDICIYIVNNRLVYIIYVIYTYKWIKYKFNFVFGINEFYFIYFYFIIFWWEWGLKSGLCVCNAGTLPLKSILFWLFWRWGSRELFALAGLKPQSWSQPLKVRIIGLSYQWLARRNKFFKVGLEFEVKVSHLQSRCFTA